MKKVFNTVWAVWVALWFVVTAIFAFLGFIISFNFFRDKRAFNAGVLTSRLWSAAFLYGILMPVKAHNKNIVEKDKVYVVISNHLSQLDIPASLVIAPLTYRFLSKKEVEKMPVVRYPLKRLHLLVDRKSRESRAESQRRMKDSLAEGISIIIFPEGTRNPGPGLTKEFYNGAFKLAVETGTPIIVQTVVDTWERQNAHMGFQFSPGPINIYFDGPISTTDLADDDIHTLKARVRDIMEEHLRAKYGESLL